VIFPLACALVIVGIKIWMIDRSGSPTPFWDQWDAEGAALYPQYLSGTLRLSDLIAPHNEHRLLVTRLWSLLLFGLAGYWDPILQMLANTAILGAVVALLAAAFRPVLDAASWIALTVFATVIYALPFGWESTLAGFHSQWYFMLLFSIAGLLAIVHAAAFTPRWWLALLLGLLGYFSMAPGMLAVVAGFSTCAVQFVVGRRSGPRELAALAVFAAATIVMAVYTPVIADNAWLKAHSIGQFLGAVIAIASWPATSGDGIALMVVGAALVHAPALLTSVSVIRLRPPLDDRRWLLVALTGWAALQTAAIAYGRATAPTSSRYLDVLAVALVLNCGCLLVLLREPPAWWRRRRHAVGALALWLLLVLGGMTVTLIRHSIPDLAHKQMTGRVEQENLRAYLETGDIGKLENKPFLAIPYPDPQRLGQIAADPVIRAVLPPALVGAASAERAQQRGLARFTGRPIEALKDFMLRWGALLTPVGGALFLLGLSMQVRRGPETAPPRE
jgi:hypothetical protein